MKAINLALAFLLVASVPAFAQGKPADAPKAKAEKVEKAKPQKAEKATNDRSNKGGAARGDERAGQVRGMNSDRKN
jgi:hypothetical protein